MWELASLLCLGLLLLVTLPTKDLAEKLRLETALSKLKQRPGKALP